MKILITGSQGQLGSELKALETTYPELEMVFTDVEDLDITNNERVLSFFQDHQFNCCSNCAAYTAVDKAETDRALCDKINVTGSANLAYACKEIKATLFHVSTDFVFDGNASMPLSEDQKTDPVNYYGLSKLNGERAIREVFEHYFIIRTSWLYSSFGGNFVKTMLRLGKTKNELNVIVDQIGSPTYAKDLAELILKVIKDKSKAYGLYHYSNEGVASWYDFTSAIFEYSGITIPVHPIPTTHYPTPAKRPHYSVMDKQKIRETFQVPIPHWRESLKNCLNLL